MKVNRPIAISLSPNTEKDDVLLVLQVLVKPWIWFDESKNEKLEKEFESYFGDSYKAISFNSGRSAEWAILKALEIGSGDEVLMQSFTCLAVPNSAFWLEAKPVFVDIGKDFNIDPKDLENKISSKSKAIIIQHTFGIPGEVENIKKIAQKRNLNLIEDCAHSLGAQYKDQKVGTLGDVAFFSFGRDKVLSSVFGGMVLVKDENLYKKILAVRNNLPKPSFLWTLQQLLHPILFNLLILPLYSIELGKLILYISQKLNLLSLPVYKEEKLRKRPNVFPAKMSPALSVLAVNQFKKLDKFNEHREVVSEKYFEELKLKGLILPPKKSGSIWLRFPILVKNPRSLFKFLKKNKILIGDWYKENIAPSQDPSIFGYKKGSCPVSEDFSQQILNLPTYPTLDLEDVDSLISLIKKWKNTNQN